MHAIHVVPETGLGRINDETSYDSIYYKGRGCNIDGNTSISRMFMAITEHVRI
jgi:hypothetical protein